MVTCQCSGESWHAALYLRAPGNYGFSGPLEDVALSTLGTGQGFSINFRSVPSSGVRGVNTDVPTAPRLSHIKQFGRYLREKKMQVRQRVLVVVELMWRTAAVLNVGAEV